MSTTDCRPPDPLVRSFARLGPGLVIGRGLAAAAVAFFATAR